MYKFKLHSDYFPKGDQPKAISQLVDGLNSKLSAQTLLGVTGSGKTFTVANVIDKIQKPTLVIAHNKTLAAQLVQEFRTFFPQNAVEYFVSYYDYYQPEAYVSSSDTYIEKEVQINEEIDRLRHAATSAVLTRKDVIVVSSVSCIYGLGSPSFYKNSMLIVVVNGQIDRKKFIEKLVSLHYQRNDILARGRFRVIGQVLEIVPAGRQSVFRIIFRGNKVIRIIETELTSGKKRTELTEMIIYPAKHFIVPEPVIEKSLQKIQKEMQQQIQKFEKEDKFLEAQRIKMRTTQDIEMMRELGYCNGIENYSMYLTERKLGEAPYTLMDYFGDDFLLIIDESHVTIPQIGGMYSGDRARKLNLVNGGFRLPSAIENRPLNFEEFENKMPQTIFVSATPAEYEKKHSQKIVEQIIRPTGLLDPMLVIRPTQTQIKDVMLEIQKTIKKGEKVLITTLTKKQSEDLSQYLDDNNIKSKYLHSDVDTLDRIMILENLRNGKFDVLVGVNLLREGLDLPEVSLVAILDADKEGFLRSEVSLIQTIGRAARNKEGKVLLYADKITKSLKKAIDETNRRRKLQKEYNKKNNITPETIKKNINSIIDHEIKPKVSKEFKDIASLENIDAFIKQMEKDMKKASDALDFEKAAIIRDEIKELRKLN